MENINTKIKNFIKDEDGLTIVEYAIAGGLVGAGVIVAFGTVGTEVNRIISKIGAALVKVKII